MPLTDYLKKKALDVTDINDPGASLGKAQLIKLVGFNFDNFEDGSVSEWTGAGTDSFTAQTGTVISGAYSGELSANGTVEVVNKTSFAVQSDSLSATIRCDNQSSNSSDRMAVGFTADNGNSIGLIYFNDNGSMEEVFTSTTLRASWSTNTDYTVEFRNIDYSGQTYDIYINGTQEATGVSFGQAFENDNFAGVQVENRCDSSGISRNVYVDDFKRDTEDKTGNGDIVIDFANISDAQDIAVYDQDGNLLDYEIEDLDTTAETGVLWCYNSWVRDGSTQAQIAYGSNSQNVDRSNTEGTWNNTGQNAVMVQHLNGNATDSTSNNNDGTVNGATSITGQINGAYEFDGVDDDISVPDSSSIKFGSGDQTIVVNYTTGVQDTGNRNPLVTKLAESGTFNGYAFGGGVFGGAASGEETDLEGYFEDANGNFLSLETNFTMADNTAYHAAMKRTGDTIEIVADGNSQGTSTNSIGSTDHTDNLVLALFREGDDERYPGKISEVRMYSDSKDNNWLQADYDASPKAGQVFFSQQAAEETLAFNGTTTTANASGTGETISLSGTTTASTTTANANSSGDTIFIEPDFATLKAVATATGQTTNISGTATINTVAAEATATGTGQLKIRLNLKNLGAATATATGGETQTDRLKGSTDVDGQPTAGVDVNVIDKTNNILYETVTDSDGNWIVDSGSGIKYQVAYLYDDGSVYYGDAEETNT